MEVIFVLAFLALIALWAFSLIGLVNPKKWQRLHKNKDVTRKDVFVGCIAGSAILIIVMVISVPDLDSNSVSGKTAPEAERVQQAHNTVETSEPNAEAKVNTSSLIDQVKDYDKTNILAVRTHGKNVLEIDLKASEGAFSDSGYLDHSGREAKDILVKIIQNNSNEKFNVVRFVIIGQLTDQYNKTFESPIFQLTYDLNEVKKINLDTVYVDYKIFLNFSKFGMRHPVADSIYTDWCKKEGNAEQSGEFCNKVR